MRATVLAALAVVCLGGCGRDEPPQRLVAFGHSYVRGGVGGVRPWVERAAERLGLRLDNQGVNGAVSAETAARVDTFAPRSSDTVIVETAINDVCRVGVAGLATYTQSLERIARHLRGARRVVLVMDPPVPGCPEVTHDAGSPLERYRDATRTVAERAGARFVDLGAGWDPRALILGDQIHPNEAGAARIADRVAAELER